jgi:hypothetical protein
MLGFAPGLGKANPTGQTIGLVTVGLKLKESFGEGCHIALPDHVINEESITLIEPEDAVLNPIQENEVLAYSYEEENKYQELSTVLFEGSARQDVTTELNPMVIPLNLIPTNEPVTYPRVNIQRNGGNVVVSSANKEVEFAPGTQDQIQKTRLILFCHPNLQMETQLVPT